MKRFFLLLNILCVFGYAQVRWSLNGVRISVASSNQQNAQCASDMDYGAIIAWEDNRNNSAAYDIYAQRVDSSGNLLWTPGGVPVCVDILYSQENIVMCSDEAGGAIIVWQDYRNPTGPDLYAQRIDGNGTCLWQANGVPVCTASDRQGGQVIVPDGHHGAIVVWCDERHWPDGAPLYAQSIDANGIARWQANGVAVCTTAAVYARYPEAISDDVSGAYIVWQSSLYWTQYRDDIFFQHIDSLGNHLLSWTGRMIVGDTALQQSPKIVRGIGETFIVAWSDGRNAYTTKSDIYAQRIDTLGNALWDSTGLPICTADSIQDHFYSNLVADGLGGAMISWYDRRNGNPDVYGQRIAANGNQVWRTNGIPVCSLPGVQYEGPGVSDDSMGVIFKWPDDRNGLYEEYLQRIGPDGIERWTPQGVRACTVSVGDRAGGPALCPDGKGGAFTFWTDYRYGSYDTDIWGQRVNDGHAPGITENELTYADIAPCLEIFPNPFTHTTLIRYSILDAGYLIQNPKINIYDVAGCLVRSFNPESSIQNQESEVSWDGRDYANRKMPAGVYFVQLNTQNCIETKKVILLE